MHCTEIWLIMGQYCIIYDLLSCDSLRDTFSLIIEFRVSFYHLSSKQASNKDANYTNNKRLMWIKCEWRDLSLDITLTVNKCGHEFRLVFRKNKTRQLWIQNTKLTEKMVWLLHVWCWAMVRQNHLWISIKLKGDEQKLHPEWRSFHTQFLWNRKCSVL